MMRRVIAAGLHRASFLSGYALHRAKTQRVGRILTYHGISDDEISADLFAWQLAFLRSEFELVSLGEIVRRQKAGAISGCEIAITFDDGVRNHVTVAHPILRELRAPATFFICPGLVESGRWIWSLDLRLRLNALKPQERAALAVEMGAAGADVESLVERAKRLDLVTRKRVEASVFDRTREFSPSPRQVERCSPMSWLEAASLDPALVTIGSHTLSHPILSSLSEVEQHTEIVESKRLLEQRLHREIDFFCYPNGDFDVRSNLTVRRHYAAAFSSQAAALCAESDSYVLPRIHAGQSQELFVRRLYRHSA